MTDIPPVDAPTLDKLIEWASGYLERKRAGLAAVRGFAEEREHNFAIDLWTGMLSALQELKKRRAEDPPADPERQGPMWIPLADINRMMTRCKESTAEKLDVHRLVLEGLLYDSLLWRKDRVAMDVLTKERDTHQRTSVRLGDINVKRAQELRALLDSWSLVPDPENGFQARVYDWMQECFRRPDSLFPEQRSFRFLEEALELAQASGTGREDALRLVDYVYSRPPGEIYQEIGGVMVSLAGLATSVGHSMENAAETELNRCRENTERIRAKDLAKPERSPLPGPADPDPFALPPCPKGGRHLTAMHRDACYACNPSRYNRLKAIDSYAAQFGIHNLDSWPPPKVAFADGWDACFIQRPQRARAGTFEVGATEDRREVVINAPYTPDNGSGWIYFAFTPHQAVDLAETLFRKVADCLPESAQGKEGERRHPTLVRMALTRATTLRDTHMTNPEHTYIVALADEYLSLLGLVKLWQTACTGRNGSQQPCVKHVQEQT